jgi:gliding motility-associated-like protein
MVFRTLAYSPDGVYVGLDFYAYWDTHIEVCKLDPKTGNLVWVKHFAKTDETSITNLGIDLIKDTLFVAIGLQKESTLFNYTFNTALLKLKERNGEQLGAFRLSTPNMATPTDIEYINSDRAASFFIKTGDNAFAIAKECVSNKDTTIQITKFYSNGLVAWSRDYPNLKRRTVLSVRADGTGMLITGVLNGVNDINEISQSGFAMRVNDKGEIEGGTTGNCENIAATATTSPIAFTEGTPQITGDGTSAYGPVTSSPTTMALVPSPTLAYPSCFVPSNCNTLDVTGAAKFCGLGQAVAYSAERNADCDMPIAWQVDTASVAILATTATTLKVRFKKYGDINIIALLDAGCKMIKDTVKVTVSKAAGELDLGPDTLLCAGTTYHLDAGGDFKDFLWQDGSTSQTYDATKPGVYKVSVTDRCGKTASDEVSIESAPVYPFSLGPDINKCREAAVTLNVPEGFSNYAWNTDFGRKEEGGKVTLSPDRDTTYILTAEKGPGCVYKDTLRVRILTPAPIDLGPDTAVCENDSLRLSVAGAFSNIAWSTGQADAGIFVRKPGLYSVTAFDGQHCISSDTMELLSPRPLPPVNLPHIPAICANSTQQLDAGNGGVAYLWSTGQTASSISVNVPGNWWVRVTGSDGSVAVDTAFVKEVVPLPHDFLGPDTSVCIMGSIDLLSAKNYNTYRWNTGAHSPKLTVTMPGIYWLEVTDKNGCTGRDTVNVGQKDCLKGLYVPTAFSPNGDGVNDLLRPVLGAKVVKYKFRVYNRWGTLVFESSELRAGWDGSFKGHIAPTGSYIWMCSYQLQDKSQRVSQGAVLLIR